jgi:hypothetical protein
MEPPEKLLERLKAGNGLVVYGFEPGNDETTEFIEAVRAAQGDCPLFSISQNLPAIHNPDAFDRIFVDMETVRNRVRQHLPLILTVKTTRPTVRINRKNAASLQTEFFGNSTKLA